MNHKKSLARAIFLLGIASVFFTTLNAAFAADWDIVRENYEAASQNAATSTTLSVDQSTELNSGRSTGSSDDLIDPTVDQQNTDLGTQSATGQEAQGTSSQYPANSTADQTADQVEVQTNSDPLGGVNGQSSQDASMQYSDEGGYSIIPGFSPQDEAAIKQLFEKFFSYLEKGDGEAASKLVVDDNKFFDDFIKNNLDGREFKINYNFNYPGVEAGFNLILLNGSVDIESEGLSVMDRPTFMIVEKRENEWLIAESDLYKHIMNGDVQKLQSLSAKFIKYGFIMFPLSIAGGIFWVLMLYDCAKRDFDDRSVWLLVLTFTGILGAAPYYFLVKREDL